MEKRNDIHSDFDMTLDLNRMRNDIIELLSIGERKAGTREMELASKYVKDRLVEAGFETEILHFPIMTSFILGTPRLSVNGSEVPCKGGYFSGNAKERQGELVYDPDLTRSDIEGKIVLTDVSYSPPRPAKARIALERGALGIIYISFGSDDSNLISTGGIKYVWGNPTAASIMEIPRIPAVSISRSSGNALIKTIKNGERLGVTLDIETKDQWVEANQPVGFRGTRTRNLIMFGTPFEALGATGIDNSAANAALLEIARNIKIKNYDVMIVFTDGHEIGEAAGSTYMVDSLWPYLKEKCEIYINVESLGTMGAKKPVTRASPLIRKFTKRVELNDGIDSEYHYEIRIADSSFTGIGVPYYWFTYEMDDEYTRKYHGANHGWWYKTEADNIEHIDFELLRKETSHLLNLYEEILKYKHVPYSIVPYIEDSIAFLRKGNLFGDPLLKERYSNLLDVSQDAINAVRKLEESVGCEESGHEILKLIIREVSNVFMTIKGRYDQDPYGAIWKDEIFPGLSIAMRQYDQEPKTGFTTLLREINRVYDAMDLIRRLSRTRISDV